MRSGRRRSRWIAALVLGLLSSAFSTLVSQFSAGRIGRDAAVDWMTVAAIPARDWAISAPPSWSAIATGIAFHQWADLSWALVFFGLLGRWTANLRPSMILLVALPWAVFTSAMEWFVLVPLFPFWQPLFTLQQPYWIGMLVHMSSALLYPLFARLRWVPGHTPPGDVRFTTAWLTGAVATLSILGITALLGSHGREPRWLGHDETVDQTYMRHMTTHHAQGIELARLAVDRAHDAHLRKLASVMLASQAGENAIFQNWWRSWFDTEMPGCSADERAVMPGYLTVMELRDLRTATPEQFDARFVALMSQHHRGAVKMADEMWRSEGDPRLRIMAHAIRHEQQGEIAMMQKVDGTDAVATAFKALIGDNVNPSAAWDR